MYALGAAQNTAGPSGDFKKIKKTMTREDQTNIRPQNQDDDILSLSLSRSHSPILKQLSFEGISGSIFFEKIYFFYLKKIYCLIYFDEIYRLI